MKVIAIAPKDLLPESMWGGVNKKFEIVFVDKKDLLTFDYNFDCDNKALLIDPDYIDWHFPNAILRNIKNLKAVCLTTTTASYVDEEWLDKNGIRLLTVPKYSNNSVAEYLVFLMLCLAKKLPLQLRNDCKQDFTDEFKQVELTGKTVGVVGFGNIGARICQMTNGMGMTPIYWNRSERKNEFKAVSLEELFKTADVIFITLANNPQTKKIVTDELLKSMKPTAILVSGTGVELHNDELVRKMLKSGDLFGFGAEIPNKSFKDYEGNVMITSEYAWFTKEATARREEIIFQNIMSL